MSNADGLSQAFTEQTGQGNGDIGNAFSIVEQCPEQTPQGGIVSIKSKSKEVRPFPEKMPPAVPAVAAMLAVSTVAAATPEAWKAHYDTLSAMDLRRLYPREATCHRNMLDRRKRGAIISPEFLEFRSFLRHVGPMPAKATLDRIDPHDPEYGPGKVRWADKLTQTRNRTNTVLINTHWGQLTADQLAQRLGVSPDTVRKQRKRGWTDDEIVKGKRVVPAASPVAPTLMKDPAKAESAVNCIGKERQEVGAKADGRPRDLGWWISLFHKFQPTPDEIAQLEHWLFSKREPRMKLVDREAAEKADFAREREEGNRAGYIGEPLPACWGEMVSDHPELLPPDLFNNYTECRNRFDRYYLPRWQKAKPYVIFSNLNRHQLDQIRRVDPDYIRQMDDAARAL